MQRSSLSVHNNMKTIFVMFMHVIPCGREGLKGGLGKCLR